MHTLQDFIWAKEKMTGKSLLDDTTLKASKLEEDFIKQTEKYEKEFTKTMQAYFRDQEAEVLSMIGKAFDDLETKGGAGSGNFGHQGRPGQVGGSSSGSSPSGEKPETGNRQDSEPTGSSTGASPSRKFGFITVRPHNKINKTPGPFIHKASPNALADRFDFSGWEYKNGRWNKRLKKEGGLFIKKVFDREGKRVWKDLSYKIPNAEVVMGAFDVENPRVQEFLDDYSFRFAEQINTTTVNAVRSAISQGMSEGLGMTDISNLVQEYFDGCTKYRAMLIARTETIRASNAGAALAYEQSGVVQGMQWLATEDDRTCPLCNAMNGRYVANGEKYFELGDRLTVDTDEGRRTMVFDYEPVRYPPLHVNCRCTVVPVVIEKYRLPKPKKVGLASIIKGRPINSDD